MRKIVFSVADSIAVLLKKHKILVLFVVALITVLLSFRPFTHKVIIFNQNYIEKQDFDALISNYSARLNNLRNGGKAKEIDFSNPDSLLKFVYLMIPYYAIVRPTEMYYYFIIPEYGIWGNLNFKEIKDGKLSFGYFDSKNIENSKYKLFDSKDGVSVNVISENVVKVTYQGKTIKFKLSEEPTSKPEALLLAPNEEFIAKVTDESTVKFYLIFNNKTNSFYYLTNEEEPITEYLKDIGDDMFLGERTGFIYYFDRVRERKVLIGVNSYNIMANNYFDGPFDQVPPRLEIREKLYKSYPYTQYMHGLDPHGNFIDFEGTRVAISPYTNYYSDTEEVKTVVKKCLTGDSEPSVLLSCITYESKKDFHKTIPDFFYPDGKKK